MVYVKVHIGNKGEKEAKKESIISKILTRLLPKANPDYEDKIEFVSDWLLEFDSESSTPNREIGLNNNGIAIMKMPYNNNYGYWTDNSLTFNDFTNSFEVKIIDQDYFTKEWNKIER